MQAAGPSFNLLPLRFLDIHADISVSTGAKFGSSGISHRATVKLRAMLVVQSCIPLHYSKEIKALAPGLGPTVAASFFLF